jgi:hypothetical protein
LDGFWVLHYYASTDKKGRVLWWLRAQASIALRDAAQVAEFRGMVVDFKTKLLKRCLMDLPAEGPIGTISSA